MFNTIESLVTYVSSVTIPTIAKQMQPDLHQILQERIKYVIYSRPANTEYDRTYSFLNSVDTKMDSNPTSEGTDIHTIVEAFTNPEKMTYRYPSSFPTSYAGDDNRERITAWLIGTEKRGTGYFIGQRSGKTLTVNYPRYDVIGMANQITHDSKFTARIKLRLRASGYEFTR